VTQTLDNQQTSTPLSAAYWRQLLATGISNVGDGINAAALPLLALTLTDDARLIAGVTVAAFIPWLLLALPAGVIVDRYNRQTLMVVTNIARAFLMAGVAITAATGSLNIWLLYLLLLGLGLCEVLFDSSAQAFLPAIVDSEQLPKANGRLYAVETVANNFLGQPFGALLFSLTLAVPFALDAASFVIAALLVAGISVRPGALPPSKRGQPTKFRSEIAESMRWLWRDPLLRAMAILLGVVNVSATFGVSIFVKFATETLGVSTRWFGALLALMALGAVLGGMVGDRVVHWLGRSTALRCSYVAFAIATLGIGLSPNYWVVAAFSFVDAFAGTVWNIVSVSLRQRIIPSQLFGRVNSVYRWIGTGATAIGAVIGGQLAFHLGLRAPWILGGITIMVAFAFGAKFLSERRIEASLARS